MKQGHPIRIAIVAGEHSGDLLGAGLISELRNRFPGIEFAGIGGPKMQALGCNSLYDMDVLAVIGMTDIRKIYHAFKARSALVKYYLEVFKPDIFIGIDVPDFNLGLARKLKEAGITTVQYVSPQVWAWRQYRVKSIGRSIDHMLTLFPFEADYYRHQSIPVTFVGHPLAEIISPNPDKTDARKKLGLAVDKPLVALLPGSRTGEVMRLGRLFIEAAVELQKNMRDVEFVVPMASQRTAGILQQQLASCDKKPEGLHIVDGQSREAMAAADVVLSASGTATLETTLTGRPMVVAYRVSWSSYLLIMLFAHVDMFALPNHLAGYRLVPELMQRNATPGRMARALLSLLTDKTAADKQIEALGQIREQLAHDANARAAEAVSRLLEQG